MRIALLFLALSLGATACAPRMSKTHFARWADQDQMRRDEKANDEKVEAWMRAQAGVAPASTEKAPGSTPRTATQTQSTRATGTHDTPPITKTSTRSSRVVKPSDANQEPDDDAVY